MFSITPCPRNLIRKVGRKWQSYCYMGFNFPPNPFSAARPQPLFIFSIDPSIFLFWLFSLPTTQPPPLIRGHARRTKLSFCSQRVCSNLVPINFELIIGFRHHGSRQPSLAKMGSNRNSSVEEYSIIPNRVNWNQTVVLLVSVWFSCICKNTPKPNRID